MTTPFDQMTDDELTAISARLESAMHEALDQLFAGYGDCGVVSLRVLGIFVTMKLIERIRVNRTTMPHFLRADVVVGEAVHA